jgi:hypothetical protein
MTFFNKKEEVLDIKLTQFGKQLLSTGRFKPVYYEFFDDNILYDGAYAGITEEQNDIEPRIQENTVQNRTQHVFSGIESNFSVYIDPRDDITIPETDRIRVQPTPEKEFSLINSMGDSDLQSTFAPAWRLTLLEGEIASASFLLTGAYQDLQIPQVDINVAYVTKVLDEKETENNIFQDIDLEDGNLVFRDGSSINVSYKNGNKNLLLMVEEDGVTFKKENFEVEIFYVEPSDGSYMPLSFMPEKSNIINGLLVPNEVTDNQLGNQEVDDTFVEFFFDIIADSKIIKSDICNGISKVKSKGIYVDSPLECEEVITSPVTISPYAEGATGQICEDE